MPKEYIEQRDGGYRVAGTRVSLDSVVYAFLRGESPEGIAESFPALTLEQVFGALAYYSANRDEVDVPERPRGVEALRQEWRRNHPALHAKLMEARGRRLHAGMRPRQADADFNNKIIMGLRRREPAIDVRSAREVMSSQSQTWLLMARRLNESY
jgi:uncharacterized protein (DUF433 family)